MRQPFIVLVSALIVASATIVGCSQAAPAPAPTAAPAKAAAPAAQPTAAPAKAAQPTAAPAAAAQPTAAPAKKLDWPQQGRAISAIVPFAAGGATDISARIVLAALEKQIGTSIQIENKGGGGSQVGNTEVATAKPDGYTIAYAAMPTLLTSYLDPARQAAYTRSSFVTIARPTADSIVLAVLPSSPYKSVKDLVDAAKANPEQVKAAVSGPMSVNDIPRLLIEKQAGVKFAAVNFDGSRPGITALLGGHVDVAFALVSEVQPQFKSGDLKILAVMDSQPSEFLPGVPTLASQGFDISMLSSHVMLAPAGTPKEIVDFMSAGVKKVTSDPDVVSKLKNAGQLPRYLDSAQLATYWEEQEKAIQPLMSLSNSN